MNIKFIILLPILISISYCKVKRIFNLTENEFIEVSKGTKDTKQKWLMIFYTNDYHSYDKFMDLLNEDIYTYYEKKKNIKFGLIDCKSSNSRWLINILDIKSIPYLILVSNGKMYYYNNDELSQENIIKFINTKHPLEESFPVPDNINIFTKGKIMYKLVIGDLNEYFQGYLDKYGLNYKWNNAMTLIVIGIVMIVFFLFELFLINLFCIRRVSNTGDINKIKKEIINKENDKKEKKSEVENKENKKDKVD